MSKRLTKTIWYGSDVDSNGNPILPSTHGGLDGLNYGELFLHLSNGKATLWTLSSDGKIVEITGGGSEVDMSSYLLKSIWDKAFEIRTDSQGTEYIFGKIPVVTQYGITMYSGDGVDVPSIASGLPFDERTIWYNPDTQQIEVIGGTGGGSGEGVSNFWDLSGIPSWITNSKPKYTYSEIEGTPDLSGYATQTWVKNQGYLTQHQDLSGYQTKITSSNKLAYSLISGTPTSLKNPNALSFGSKSYDGSAKITLTAGDLGALTSHQTIYTLTFASGTFASGNFTANSANKTINIPTTTSHISEGSNLYFTNTRAINALAETLKAYVTLSGSQTITGEKNFTGGLKVNGSPIYYDSTKKYWKLEGDLLVTGGVTMYGSDSSFTPSTIMDAIAVDGTTISKSGGVLKVVGGTGGGVADSVAWVNITGKPTFATVATSGKYSDLSGLPTIPTIPSSLKNPYSLTINNSGGTAQVTYDGSAAKSLSLTKAMVGLGNVENTALSTWTGTNKIATLGTITSGTWNGSKIANAYLANSSVTISGESVSLGGSITQSALRTALGLGSNAYTSTAYLPLTGNASSATKLQIARTIWGQSFDGTGDVSGNLILGNGHIARNDGSGTARTLISFDTNSTLFNYGLAGQGYKTYIEGNEIIFRYGTGHTRGMTILSSGNVGIGTATPSAKLHVSGDILSTGGITTNNSVTINGIKLSKSKDGVLYLDGNLVVKGGVTMYGTDATSSPSILDSLPIASTSSKGIAQFNPSDFAVKDGVVSFIGSVDGGVASYVAWGNITGKPSWIGSSKPSYSYSEITGAISTTELQNYLTQNSYLNVTSGDNRYLKLSGGTLTGKTSISARLSITNGAYLEFVDKNESIRLLGVYPNKNDLSYYDGAWNKVWHEGNFNPSNYLPLSGGTISGNYGALIIHRTNENSSLIKYSNSSGVLGHLGFNSSQEPFVYKGTDTTNQYKIWHTGNDGEGSGLDADLLDGVQLNELFTSLSSGSTNKLSITIGGVTKNLTTLYASYTNNFRVVWDNPTSGTYELNDLVGGIVRHYGSGGSLNNAPSSFGNGAVLALSNCTKGLSGQLAWNIVHNSTTNVTNKLWWRAADSTNGFTYSQWKQIAFTDSNVASATKLETARTIWGQSFDGTGNVSGDVTLDNKSFIKCCDTSGNSYNTFGLNASNLLLIGYGTYGAGYATSIYGGNIRLYSGTSGAANFILDSSGNVGIGTTAPDYKFHVVGTSHINGEASFNSSVTLKGTGSTTARIIMSRSSYNYINYPADGSLCLGTSNASASTQLFIDGATGNVGVGTVAPSAKLHVVGNSHLKGTIFVTNADATTTVEDSGKIKFNSLNTRDDFRSPYIQAIHQGNYSRKRLSIFQSNATNYTDDFVEAFTILPNGNVGIGTASPTSKLHVSGDILATGAMTFYSMRKLKNVVDERGLSLSELSTIKPTRYTWKDGRDNRLHFGGIADDVQQVLPEVVYSTSDGILTMDYGNAAFAVASSLIKPVIDHEKRIAMLEAENKQLRQEVERLKSA